MNDEQVFLNRVSGKLESLDKSISWKYGDTEQGYMAGMISLLVEYVDPHRSASQAYDSLVDLAVMASKAASKLVNHQKGV